MSPLVSVIVPIYKVEQYLKRCIDSIIAQTYKNIEIILVDDGSPDNCGAICDEYALNNGRIKVVHKPNGGLSDARNKGIEVSKGDYICFVDSDDYVEKDYIEKMLSAAELSNADLVISNFKYVYEDGTIKKYEFEHEFKSYSSEESMEILVSNNMSIPLVVAWSKLYAKKLFSEYRFKKGLIHEDEEICHKIINSSNKIVIIDDVLYNYVQRTGSIMNEIKLSKDLVVCDILKDRYEFLVENGYNKIICENAFLNYYASVNKFIYLSKKHKNRKINADLSFEMKKILNSKSYKNIKLLKRAKLCIKRLIVKLNFVGLVYGVLKRSDFNG